MPATLGSSAKPHHVIHHIFTDASLSLTETGGCPMALFCERGTISRLGQSEFNNDFCIYAFIEISTPEGERRLLKKIIVFSDMHAAMDVGMEGQFFFDDVFVHGRRYLAQFW